jgi:hypothetical protein
VTSPRKREDASLLLHGVKIQAPLVVSTGLAGRGKGVGFGTTHWDKGSTSFPALPVSYHPNEGQPESASCNLGRVELQNPHSAFLGTGGSEATAFFFCGAWLE